VHVPAHDLDVLIAFGMRLPALDELREEKVHALVAEPGCRKERAELGPTSAGESHLLLELPPRARQRRLPGFECSSWKFDESASRRLAQLPNERDVSIGVDGDDRGRTGMLHDLALAARPRLDHD